MFGSLASVQEQRLPNAAASIDAEETPPITPTSAQHSKVMLHLPRSLARSLTFISFSLSVSIYLSFFLSVCLIYLSIYLSIYLCISLSIYLSIFQSSYISNYRISSLRFSFLFLSVSLSLIYLLIYLFVHIPDIQGPTWILVQLFSRLFPFQWYCPMHDKFPETYHDPRPVCRALKTFCPLPRRNKKKEKPLI